MHSRIELGQRAVTGGFWVFLLRVIRQLFYVTRLIIIARVLAPYDFGLMGLAILTISALETFSEPGFRGALIQKKEDIASYLDCAWTVIIIRGIIIFIILYLISPFVSSFFVSPEANTIIRVVGVSILLKGFINIRVIYFQKEMDFKKQFIFQFSATLIDFIVAISAVFLLRNVWALIFGLLAGNVTSLIMSYVLYPSKPRLHLDVRKASELFNYGKWVLGSSILFFLIIQGEQIFVGKVLGIIALGFYQIAYQISNLPVTEITHAISEVTFPFYSKIQDNISELKKVYLRVLESTVFLSFLIASLIFVLATDFTLFFLGEKWLPMVPTMQVLAIAGIVRSIAATTGPVFSATGNPKIETKWQLVRLTVLILLIFPFSAELGILGTSISVFFSITVATIGFIVDTIKITKCKVKDFIRIIGLSAINAFMIQICVILLKNYIPTSEQFVILLFFITIIIAVIISFANMYLFNRVFGFEMLSFIKGIIFSLSSSFFKKN